MYRLLVQARFLYVKLILATSVFNRVHDGHMSIRRSCIHPCQRFEARTQCPSFHMHDGRRSMPEQPGRSALPYLSCPKRRRTFPTTSCP
jgi:hypothetical protein